MNGARYHVHANKIKKFNVRVHEVVCDSVLLYTSKIEGLSPKIECNSCSIIYDCDIDFGDINVIESTVNDTLPSQQIAPEVVAH